MLREETRELRQAPVRNASIVGSNVYSHSGEFAPRVIDLMLPGRGLSFAFARKYRSGLSGEIGSLGRGWSFAYDKRLEGVENGVSYADGLGGLHRFALASASGAYASPDGFYAVLSATSEGYVLEEQYGTRYVFENLDAGGRLVAVEDRNGNRCVVEHAEGRTLIVEPLGRTIEISRDERGRISLLADHAGRTWSYGYDEADRLTELVRPATEAFPEGTRVAYDYDDEHRLVSVTDPKGQTFLRNSFDEAGRVVRQEHGAGFYEFEYEQIDETNDGAPVYRTRVRQKNGATLLLEHDRGGHVARRTLFVSSESLSAEDRDESNGGEVPLVTNSRFNRHGELVQREFPAGNSVLNRYDEDNDDPRARGNLLTAVGRPAPDAVSEQEEVQTSYEYEPRFQRRRSIVDPRGNVTAFKYDERGNLVLKKHPEVTVTEVASDGSGAGERTVRQPVEGFEYNAAGQLVRSVGACGMVTDYHYYPAEDPTGSQGRDSASSDPSSRDGYLARVVRDPEGARLTAECGYDAYGNMTTVWDGKGNATRVRYDEHGNALAAVSRAPFDYEFATAYDENDNPVSSTVSFERLEYHPETGEISAENATITQSIEYDSLNQVVGRTTEADGMDLVEVFERDENDNIVRKVQPLGNVSEFRYDERNLVVERSYGAGTAEETSERFTHTPNGRRRTMTDGREETVRYDYDGFHRYRGYENPGGTSKKQRFDAAGNVVGIEVWGDPGRVDDEGGPLTGDPVLLAETLLSYDELGRCILTRRAWRDHLTGEPLGSSNWDGEQGYVTAAVEYADNGLPEKLWYETGNVVRLEYDGLDRLISVTDSIGEEFTIEYDENGNVIHTRLVGPEVEEGERFVKDVDLRYDELDRPVERSVNLEPPEGYSYNALNLPASYSDPSGTQRRYLYDRLARPVGLADPAGVERVELDANGRVVARIDAEGRGMTYRYDSLNRRTGATYPDGTEKRFERDARGNLTRIVDQNGTTIVHSFDALDRLLERRVEPADGSETREERFHYDGLNRLVAAANEDATVLRRHDTLSHLVEESVLGFTIGYRHDAAGRRVRMSYPGGEEISTSYDALGRVTRLEDSAGALVAAYEYRAGRQLLRQQLGGVLEATFSYGACQGCLGEVLYRSLPDGDLIDGSRYTYDRAGNITREEQLGRGEGAGEQYSYDGAHRLVGVRYGVEDLDDPTSPFEEEVEYDLTRAGTWREKVTRRRDGSEERVQGRTNRRHAYVSLGGHRFEYDANGNRVVALDLTRDARRPGEDEDSEDRCSEKRYTYDYANRPTKVECLDRDGNTVYIIEYLYDAFGRQVLVRITTDEGTSETLRAWSGGQVVEEYEDGNLARSFVYGANSNIPVRMQRMAEAGPETYFYALNGRGLVTTLCGDDGLAVERYRYDVFRWPSLSEDHGQRVFEKMAFSPLSNPFFSGSTLWDHRAGSYFGLSSMFDPQTGQFANPESRQGEPGCGNDYSAGENPTLLPGMGFGGYDPTLAGSWGETDIGISGTAGIGSAILAGASVAILGLAVIATAPVSGPLLVAGVAAGIGSAILAGCWAACPGPGFGSSGSGSGTGSGSGSGSGSGGGSSGGGGGGGAPCDPQEFMTGETTLYGQENPDGSGSSGGGSSGGGTGGGSGSGGGSGGGAGGGTGGGSGGSGGGSGGTGGEGGGGGSQDGGSGCEGNAGKPGTKGFTPADDTGGWGLPQGTVIKATVATSGGGGEGGGVALTPAPVVMGSGMAPPGASRGGCLGGGGLKEDVRNIRSGGNPLGVSLGGSSSGGCSGVHTGLDPGGTGGLGGSPSKPAGPGTDNPSSCGGTLGGTFVDGITGALPERVMAGQRGPLPIPTPSIGGPGPTIIPGGGYTDYDRDHYLGAYGVEPSFSPIVRLNEGVIYPSPEQTGGTCGGGSSFGKPFPECSRF